MKSYNNKPGYIPDHAGQQSSVKREATMTKNESSDRSLTFAEDTEKHYDHVEDALDEEYRFNSLVEISRDLAHGLNNMLTTILANTQLTSLMVKDAEVKPYLDAVEEATSEAGEKVRKFQESIHMLARTSTQRDILNRTR